MIIKTMVSVYAFLVFALGFTAAGAGPIRSQVSTLNSPTAKKFELQLRAGLKQKSFSNENGEHSLQVGLGLTTDSTYTLSPSLGMSATLSLSANASQVLSLFGDNASEGGVSLSDATLRWTPFSFSTFYAGAIGRSYWNFPLLFESFMAFPGVKENFEFALDKNTFSLSLEQSIPTSLTLSTKAVDKEVSPNFLAGTGKIKTKMIKSVDLEVFGSLFQFNNLPSKVAFDSALYGNSPPELLGPHTARFLYEFSGWIAGANSKIDFNAFHLNLGAQLVENMEAPQACNQGQLVYVSTEIPFSKNFSMEPRGEMFFNESDTTPAFYNSAEYGHNNREGWALELALLFRDPDFSIKAKYVEADTINYNVNQTRQQYFNIRLETSHDVL